MTKIWFKTKNHKIIDLSQCNFFEIDSSGVQISLICETDKYCLNIAYFDNMEEAEAYLDEIYQALSGNIYYRCNQCKKYPPLQPFTKEKND